MTETSKYVNGLVDAFSTWVSFAENLDKILSNFNSYIINSVDVKTGCTTQYKIKQFTNIISSPSFASGAIINFIYQYFMNTDDLKT